MQGAKDIIAEEVSDNAEERKRVRNLVRIHGSIQSARAKEEEEAENSVYATYYDFSQPVDKLQGHRVLALNRGEKEGFLKVDLQADPSRPLNVIRSLYVQGSNACSVLVQEAWEDAYSRLIYPSIEREIRAELTEKASEDAIKLFGVNLRQLLMAPPVKGKVAIGLDPGYRTGCKLAVVDATGKVLDTAVIYPTHGEGQERRSAQTLKEKIQKWGVDIIAIGNGTASKETEMFCVKVLREVPRKVSYMVVSEAGASVYSASKLAAEEMPDFDLTLRSAVSIARRLQDPLAELVKIEPKAIGVGQYQHDMPQKRLEAALDGVVESCVNSVGADRNTASPALLSHISGLSSTVCKNIVAFREENGSFESRAQLKKVPKLGPKAFEQCAGFLRVPDGKEPLDNTAVHPESYKAAKALLKHLGVQPGDPTLEEKAKAADLSALAKELEVGEPTLRDILKELAKPGRDPRDELPPPLLREDILDMKDLKEGMTLQGTVRNVIDFGAFVDIGVHQDGLVHVSQISNKFIKHPSEILKVGDVVTVKVLGTFMDSRLFIQSSLCMAAVVDSGIGTGTLQMDIGGVCPSLAPDNKLFIAVPFFCDGVLSAVLGAFRMFGHSGKILRFGGRGSHVHFFLADLILILFLPAVGLCCLKLCGGEAPFFAIPDAEIFFLCLVLPLALFIQRAHRQHDMGMGIMTVGVMDCHIGTHTFCHKTSLDIFCQQFRPLIFLKFNGERHHKLSCQSAVLGFLICFYRIP